MFRAPRFASLLLTLLAGSPAATAQTPRLVQDLNSTPVQTRSSNPDAFAAVPGASIAYFAADGRWLCRADLTSRSATRIFGLGSGVTIRRVLVAGSDKVFFLADDGLWVHQIASGTARQLVIGSDPGALVAVPSARTGGIVYFTLAVGSYGRELWRSDGSVTGTALVRDICAGAGSSDPTELVEMRYGSGPHLFFVANDGVRGPELWRTDGTSSGTVRISDAWGSTLGPHMLCVHRDLLWFVMFDQWVGREIFYTDGDVNGIQLFRDLTPGRGSSSPTELTSIGHQALFFVDHNTYRGRELFVTGGPTSGIALVKDINPGSASSDPQRLTVARGRLWFTADDGTHGRELWVTDGTAANTSIVADLRPGTSSSDPSELVAGGHATSGPLLYFTATDHRGAQQLFAAWTHTVYGLLSSTGGTDPRHVAAVDDRAIFAAHDPTHGTEPWWTDGNPSSGRLLADVNTTPAGPETHSSNAGITGATGFAEIAFSAYDGVHGYEPWISYRSGPSKTVALRMIGDLVPGPDSSYPRDFTLVGERLCFRTSGGTSGVNRWRVWVMDTPISAPRRTDPELRELAEMVAVGDRLFVVSRPLRLGWRILVLEPGARTLTLRDVLPGPGARRPRDLLAFRGLLYIAYDDSTHGEELWRTDGTSQGTARVTDIHPGSGSAEVDSLTVVGDRLFFRAESSPGNSELWVSDGSRLGTRLVKEIRPGTAGSEPEELTAVGETLLFVATTNSGRGLWKSDGTASGTVELARLTDATRLTAFGDLLFFAGQTPGAGWEPWRSDGTVRGTFMLRDIRPGSRSSSPEDAFASGARVLWFRAYDEAHGWELWRTNGWSGGTRMVADLNPGAAGSQPTPLGFSGRWLLFAATDRVVGRELFQITPGASSRVVGQGCTVGGDLVPTLRTTDPVIGRTMMLTGRSPRSGAVAFTLFSQTPPMPFSLGSGCALYTYAFNFVLLGAAPVSPGGAWSFPYPIPNLVGLIGSELTWQAAIGPSPNRPLGLDLTNAVLTVHGR